MSVHGHESGSCLTPVRIHCLSPKDRGQTIADGHVREHH